MSELSNTFKKAPRRKGDRGRRVAVSSEAKQAYAEMIKARQETDESYRRHLPQDTKAR